MRGIGVRARMGFILVTALPYVSRRRTGARRCGKDARTAPAFYDGNQVTINIFEVPSSETLLASKQEPQHDLCHERSGRGTRFRARDRCHPGGTGSIPCGIRS